MAKIIEYGSEHQTIWDEYVRQKPTATIAHQSGWLKVMADALGHRPNYLLAMDGEKVTGVLPLFVATTWWRAKYVISLPWIDYGGVLADDKETEKLLVEKAMRLTEEVGAQFLELRSIEPMEHDLSPRTDKVTFQLPLTDDPDVLWKGFNAKLRNQIRKADKSGLQTEIGGSELIGDFYKIFNCNMRDLGTPVWGREFFETVLKVFPNTAGIVLVRSDDAPVAGGLVLRFKGHMYVPSASAYRSSLKMCPNHALYWHCIKTACEQGFSHFDFGRSSWDSNTFKFKKQWMPEPKQLTWQYYLNKIDEVPRINPSNPKYRLFISMWQKLPLWLAGYLGPKVIKNFP